MCTINKSDRTEKSGNLFNDPCISLFVLLSFCSVVHRDSKVHYFTGFLYYNLLLESFSHQRHLMVFH